MGLASQGQAWSWGQWLEREWVLEPAHTCLPHPHHLLLMKRQLHTRSEGLFVPSTLLPTQRLLTDERCALNTSCTQPGATKQLNKTHPRGLRMFLVYLVAVIRHSGKD